MPHPHEDPEPDWWRIDRLGGCWPSHLLEEPRGASAKYPHVATLRRVVRARWLRLIAFLEWTSAPPAPGRHQPGRPHPLPRRGHERFEYAFGWF